MALLHILPASYIFIYIYIFSSYPEDDAFVHLKIAETFFNHGLPYHTVDNPGFASSSIVWILILSVLHFFTDDVLSALSIFASLVGVGLYFSIFSLFRYRHLNAFVSAVFSWLLVVMFTIKPSSGLMEAALALLFLFVSINLHIRSRHTASGVFMGLAALTRLEFFVAVFALIAISRNKKTVISIGAVTLTWLCFVLYFYKTPFPQPMLAKPYILNFSEIKFSFRYLSWPNFSIDMILPYYEWFKSSELSNLRSSIGLGSLVVLGGKSLAFAWKKRDSMAYFFISVALAILAANFVRGSIVHIWYWPLIFVPLYFGSLLTARYSHTVKVLLVFSLLPVSGFAVGQFRDFIALTTENHQMYLSRYHLSKRITAYTKAANQLNQLDPLPSVLLVEAGAFPYFYKGNTIEVGGNINLESFEINKKYFNDHGKTTHFQVLPVHIEAFQPEFIVAHPGLISAKLLNSDDFQKTYKLDSEVSIFPDNIPITVWGQNRIHIFKKIVN